jgi:hypothetical protein
MILEVDVQPLTPVVASLPSGDGDKLGPHSPPPNDVGHHGVENEGMGGAVPGDIDEPDERPVLPGTHPTQTVAVDPYPPVLTERPEPAGMQPVDLDVVEPCTPLIADHRPTVRNPTTRFPRRGSVGAPARLVIGGRRPPLVPFPVLSVRTVC